MTVETKEKIVLMRPYVTDAMRAGVMEVLNSRYVGQGPRVDEFEQRFSKMLGRTAVAVNSCTSALHLAFLLAGIGPGDEVIAPLFTCTATNIPLLDGLPSDDPKYHGAKLRFCDVEPGGLNMDPEHAHSLVTEKTKAVVVVHYGGAPVDQRLYRLGTFPVIEDCAQAIGTSWAGRQGQYACFSFQAVKHITTGDGGMLILPTHLEEKAKRLRWFGIDRVAKLNGTWANDITEVGYKYQMTDIEAAMGMAGLDALDAQIAHRRKLRAAYLHGLSWMGPQGIRVIDRETFSACWLCTVAVERREDLRRKLADAGIESDQTHYRNDRYTIFKEFRGEFPNMDAMESKYLVIPMHMGMDVGDVERICDVIRSGW